MKDLRRFSVAVLLALLLIGVLGHLIVLPGEVHHISYESTCAFHQGMDTPADVPPHWNPIGIFLDPVLDTSCLFRLALTISHPPI